MRPTLTLAITAVANMNRVGKGSVVGAVEGEAVGVAGVSSG